MILRKTVFGLSAAACGYTSYILGYAGYHYKQPMLLALSAGCGIGSVVLAQQVALAANVSEE